MTIATQTRAEFLKSEERKATATSATLLARWGAAAGDTAQSSVLDASADADAEAARQQALMGSPMAVDRVRLEGVFFDLEGRVVRVDYRLPADPLRPGAEGTYFGAPASADLLVTTARVDLGAGTTEIEGLVRL